VDRAADRFLVFGELRVVLILQTYRLDTRRGIEEEAMRAIQMVGLAFVVACGADDYVVVDEFPPMTTLTIHNLTDEVLDVEVTWTPDGDWTYWPDTATAPALGIVDLAVTDGIFTPGAMMAAIVVRVVATKEVAYERSPVVDSDWSATPAYAGASTFTLTIEP